MTHMTVLELMQCLFWAATGLIPVFFAVVALIGVVNDETWGYVALFFAFFFQFAILICAYKAGSK